MNDYFVCIEEVPLKSLIKIDGGERGILKGRVHKHVETATKNFVEVLRVDTENNVIKRSGGLLDYGTLVQVVSE